MRHRLLTGGFWALAVWLLTAPPVFAQNPEPVFLSPIRFDEFIPQQERSHIRDVVTEEIGALFWLAPFDLDEADAYLNAAQKSRLASCPTSACISQVIRTTRVKKFLLISITRVSRGVFQMEAAVMDAGGRTLLANRAIERGGVGELKYAMTGFLEELFSTELRKHAGSVVSMTVDATAITSTEADTVFDKADEAAEGGRADEAIALYEKSAAEAQTLALPYIRIARLKLASQDPQGAREAARVAVRREPQNPDAQLVLGETEWLAGDPKAAELALTTSLQLDPNQPKAAFMLGSLLSEAGRLDEASRAFSSALAAGPDQPATLVNMGLVQMRLDRWSMARDSLERALSLDGEILAVYPALASTCEHLKDWGCARRAYLTLSEKQSPCADCLFNAGRMSEQLGDVKAALSEYGRTIELDADHLDAYYSAGRLEARRGACDDAARLLGRYIENEKRPDQEAFVSQARRLLAGCTAR